MALGKDAVSMIEAIASHDMNRARMCALAAITNDTAQSREWWRKDMRKKLEAEPFELTDALPSDLRGMVLVEDSSTFRAGRFTPDANVGVINHVRRACQACERLAELGIPYANATLLHGEPGVGKTMLARWLAHDLQLPFVYVSFAHLIDAYMGATSRNIARIFQFCESYRCLLMLDELDTIAAMRSAANDGPAKELGRVTVTLMQQFDRLPSSVVLVAATNRLDIVDPALRRRFTKEFEITRPKEFDEVVCIIENFLDDCNLRYDPDVLWQFSNEWRGRLPTQDAIVKALVESIADHEIRGLSSREPVDLTFLWSLHEKERRTNE